MRHGSSLALCAVLLGGAACGPSGPAPEIPEITDEVGRVFLLGVDGATWKVIDPMIGRGELPNFAELGRYGCRGTLLSDPVSRSPRIWTSIASGVEPETHKILDFVHEIDGERSLMSSDDVAAPRIWDIASGAGVKVGVTNYWVTYPVTKVQGFMISDHTIPARSRVEIQFFTGGESPAPVRSGLVYPTELWSRIDPILQRETFGAPYAPGDSLEANIAAIHDALSNDDQALGMALAGLEAYEPRLNVIYLNGPDLVSHRFWQFFEPDHPNFEGHRPSPREVALYGGVIPWIYRHVDALIGELRDVLAPEDVLLIISDHGFGAGEKLEEKGLGGDHEVDGIFLAAGGPVAPPCPDSISLYDVAPTLLYFLDLPVPDYMVGMAKPGLLDSTYLASHPLRGTHDVADVEHIEVDDRLEEVDAERLEKLKGLGYID